MRIGLPNIGILVVTMAVFLVASATKATAAVPVIAKMTNDSAVQGATYTRKPKLVAGTKVRWNKEFGPDDMTVDPDSGEVSWAIPSGLAREAFHLGVRATNSDGSVYKTWIVKVGGGRYIYVGPSDRHKTISSGTVAASSGDTIVVRDGCYSGIMNMMNNIGADRGTIPPSGTPGIYTTIMAEHPGGALIDGEGVNQPISWQGNYNSRDRHPHNAYSTSFIAIKGFIVGRGHALPSSNGSVLYMNHVDHVKIIDVGGYDQSINDNGAILNVQRSNYVLLEGDYVWGNGREGITTYICDHTIMRRNLVRIDSDNSVEPFGGIVNYANTYSRTQNSIVIDMDQYKDYSYRYLAGAFNDSVGGARYEPWSKMIDVQTVNCIALNVYNAFTVNVQQDNGSEPTILNNVIGWDIKTMGGMTTRLDTRSYAVITAPGSMQINQATFGKWRSPLARTAFNCFINGWEYTQSLLNSVIYDVQDYNGKAGNLFFGWETVDYNNICKTGKIDFNSTRSTHTITTNPIPACIRYLPRIEPGCPLWKAGKSGARVGANIMFMRGSSGTLWGEKGYDTEGTIPMWPFPHEELIKTKLSAYSHGNGKIIGARGFCAKTSIDGSLQTLTKYIWGYLGASLLPPFNIHVVPSGSSVVVSWDADSSNSNVSGYKIYLGKSPGIYTSSSIVAGKYTTAGTIRNLACGTYFFAVTTRSPHGESGPSYEVSKSVVNSR